VAEVKRPPTWDLQDEVLVMDEARRDHLEGRYDEAIEGYRELLARPLPLDMAESVRFFLGLALLRAGAPDQAIAAFDAALTAAPRTEWAPSVRYYRAEAKLRTSDLEGALADLRAADIAPARLELTRLARSRSVASGVDSRALR
jgi:tetratricopeptide (TPR) repeat protein